jgi:hypothetical protein
MTYLIFPATIMAGFWVEAGDASFFFLIFRVDDEQCIFLKIFTFVARMRRRGDQSTLKYCVYLTHMRRQGILVSYQWERK